MRSFSSPFVNKHGGAGGVKDNTSSLLKQIIGRMGYFYINTKDLKEFKHKIANTVNKRLHKIERLALHLFY